MALEEEYEVSVQDFATHLDLWGLLHKWSAKNLPTKGMLVFEFCEETNVDLENQNRGWGEYLGKIEDLGLDLGVRCLDNSQKIKLDRDTFVRAPKVGDVIYGVYKTPVRVLGYEEGTKVILQEIKKNNKQAPRGKRRKGKSTAADDHWEATKKKVFQVWRAAVEKDPIDLGKPDTPSKKRRPKKNQEDAEVTATPPAKKKKTSTAAPNKNKDAEVTATPPAKKAKPRQAKKGRAKKTTPKKTTTKKVNKKKKKTATPDTTKRVQHTPKWIRYRGPELSELHQARLAKFLKDERDGILCVFYERVVREYIKHQKSSIHLNFRNVLHLAVTQVFTQVKPDSSKPYEGDSSTATEAMVKIVMDVFDIK